MNECPKLGSSPRVLNVHLWVVADAIAPPNEVVVI
jgi:hypothetical protein